MLTPKLIEILKSGVGLGTKVATAQLVVSLVRQCVFDLTPYAGMCLYILLRQSMASGDFLLKLYVHGLLCLSLYRQASYCTAPWAF